MTTVPKRRTALGAIAAAFSISGARAQGAWPSRPVRMVVPFPPGGLADSVARPLAARLTTVFGQPFVVDNRPGAGGNLGAEQVAKSEPDGHTLLVGSLGPLAVNAWLFPSLPFDPRAFAPVSLLIETPKVVVVNPSRPWRSLEELTAAARAAPGRLSAGSAGNGSSLHIALELYKRAAGVDVTHVPYRGAAVAITDLVGGRLDFIIDNVPNILAQIRAGAVRPLATATEARLPQLPEVPTTAEAGLPGLRFGTWFGLVAPPGTPAAVTERLAAAVDAALRDPEIGGRLAEQGAVPGGGTPEAFGRFMEAERAKLEPVVRGSGMRAD
ncbi:tripartite tricarboxylate transporter substrate binding protein [Craurococcus roseus]|uniref:Tripartite tricarboxylate transporter substrate binding protein n=1 Tax=Craurococcus roseus TaxID=77585 RepID=A0ABP3Q509_9PROT